jgi:Holliday junction DNA helicase RuvA
MIASLSGKIVFKSAPLAVIECAGVGYEIEYPLSTLLPETGSAVFVWVQQLIREDAHPLYGFGTLEERALFRELLKITGIGAKMALGVLSGMGIDDFWASVRQGDVTRLTRIPGIGKKTAERLLIELKDKAQNASTLAAAGGDYSKNAAHEAVAALIALGYKAADAEGMVQRVFQVGSSPETLIREALRRAVLR